MKVVIVLSVLALACGKQQVSELHPVARFAAPQRALVLAPTNVVGFVGDTIRLGVMYVIDEQSISCAPVTWDTSNPEVASVVGGLLTVHKEGSTTINASCGGLSIGTTGRFSNR